MDRDIEKAIERLRELGQAPRFVVPAGTPLPPLMQSPPPAPRRPVGRRIISGAPNDQGVGGAWVNARL